MYNEHLFEQDVQEQLSRALKKTEKLAAENKRLQKLISELTDAARSKIDESESADGESLRDRVKKAMISHAVTSPRRDGSAGDDLVSQVHTLTKELNKAYEKISALEEQVRAFPRMGFHFTKHMLGR